MKLNGIHHVTAITSNVHRNIEFYTEILGLRLVKKSVNQDQTSSYHLFYADKIGSPGTDVTFFDWTGAVKSSKGTDSIGIVSLKVSTVDALEYWEQRLLKYGIELSRIRKRDNRDYLEFKDFDGINLSLVVDDSDSSFVPWENSPVPSAYQVRGLGSPYILVSDADEVSMFLEDVLGLNYSREYEFDSSFYNESDLKTKVYNMDSNGSSGELHVIINPNINKGRLGVGGIHHLAFRITDTDDHLAWIEKLEKLRIPNSGSVNRYYFKSIYLKLPNGILFELATDEPGFLVDEEINELGKKLALPPFLENRREEIEASLPKINL